MAIDWSQSFDTSTALANMYLWLLFGFLATQLNCDLQRLMQQVPVVRHLVSLLAFFFLFTLIDSNNRSNLLTTWVKTVLVYILFVLTTKSKWFFAVPVLVLLLVDQSLKKYAQGVKEPERQRELQQASKVLNAVVFVTIIAGTFDYMLRQKKEYKGRFSYTTFFLGSNRACKANLKQLSH